MRVIGFDPRPGCPACAEHNALNIPSPTPKGFSPTDIEPRELAANWGKANSIQLVDIRERWEWEIARIPESRLLPMSELEQEIGSLNSATDLIVFCHHGTRSAVAAEWLRSRGFRVRSLLGGIDRWSREIDPSIPRY